MPMKILITAGPTQEPIDAVRFIGNRSSGLLGVELAMQAAERGWEVELALGPVDSRIVDLVPERVSLSRFTTAQDLKEALSISSHVGRDAVIMSAAVADFTIDRSAIVDADKLRRGSISELPLVPTEDLLAGVSSTRGDASVPVLVGFALESEDTLIERAEQKLRTKGVDLVVGNPLQTLDAHNIRATLVTKESVEVLSTLSKATFARVLMNRVEEMRNAAG